MPWNGDTWVPYDTMGNGTVTTILDIAQYNNTVTGDVFGLFMLIAFFMIALTGLTYYGRTQSTETNIATAVLLSTILSYMMAAIDMLADEIAWAMTFILVGSVILLYAKGGGSSV